MNTGECSLVADGEAVYVYDSCTDERRVASFDDWLAATRLIDTLDEVGVYWGMVKAGSTDSRSEPAHPAGEFVAYWREALKNFSKHIQDSTENPQQSRWLLEVLQTVFGDKEIIKSTHPVSFLLCPLSPLVIEGPYTDAYLETIGWDIPAAVMPMPMLGTTSPASLIATTVLSNCEVLAMLCLVQVAAPGTPFIYAPAQAIFDPHSGRFAGGAVEEALLGSAVTEMGRYYSLPVEASTGGSDHHVPGIQAGYERGINWTLPALSWPDLLVGPGLLGGAMILSLEQLMIDIEIFKRCTRLLAGIECGADQWLSGVIEAVGPGGNFLSHRSTRDALRAGELYISKFGFHDTFEQWEASGRPSLVEQVRSQIAHLLATHQPIPLGEAVERELARIEQRARQASINTEN